MPQGRPHPRHPRPDHGRIRRPRRHPRLPGDPRRHRTLDTLPAGTTVATASLRRAAAVRAYRPDLNVTPIRGPVDERLRTLHDPDSGVDALIVASCSMERLGLAHEETGSGSSPGGSAAFAPGRG
ncbi:hypothetical protein [Streptomyces sp. GF20]|uniref:hypothetical protein n=1 Tax=Streptomyces sp. GF20 TaxID=2692235 RepID=UPI003FA7E2FA